jgi:SAM-dependent methyltransferase
METVPCNFCGSNDYSELYQVRDLFLDNKPELFTFVKCNQCGLVYQNPRPSQSEIGEYYPPEYEPFYEVKPTNWIMRKMNQAGIDKRCSVVNRLKTEDTIEHLLDVGCSTGLFLDRLQQFNTWKLWGVEPSEYAARIARERFSLNVFQGDLLQANYEDRFFSVVTLWDVLEHLPDPSRSIDEIARITRPNGYLVFRVHVQDSLDAKLFSSSWAGLDAPRHYYVFSKCNLTSLLQKHGYEVQRMVGNIGVYPIFLLSIRFYLTNHHIDKAINRKILSVLNYPLSKLVTAPIFYFYGLFGFGSEITFVAKKK